MKNSTISKNFSLFGLDTDVSKKLWKHGWIYFTELLSLWIVTCYEPFKGLNEVVFGLKIDLIAVQTIGFLFGAIYFGRYMGEKKGIGKVNRVKNLMISIALYCIGTLLSIIALKFFHDNFRINALSRFVTCVGISGGIGINLTILAQSVKNGKHSAPILLFTAFGVAGTTLSSLSLPLSFYLWDYSNKTMVFVIFSIALIMGICQFFNLYKNKSNYTGDEYKNTYKYHISRYEYYTRISSFVILGLPTFFLAGILASKAKVLTDIGWFEGVEENLSSLFLGVLYTGFFLICLVFSLPPWEIKLSLKGKKYHKFNIRYLIEEKRQFVLVIGTILQAFFIIPFILDIRGIGNWGYLLILFSGAGIGINWGIIMILIFEQEEFANAKTFAATIIPNLIRLSLALILVFPSLLNMGRIEPNDKFIESVKLKKKNIQIITEFDSTKVNNYLINAQENNNPKTHEEIIDKKYENYLETNRLKGLAFLVYIPFLFTLFIFKDEGERNARLNLEKKDVENIVDVIIRQQKNNVPIEMESLSLESHFRYLKKQLKEKLKKFDFELINFYHEIGRSGINGTDYDEDEKKNERLKPVKNILRKAQIGDSINLLEISSDKRLNCVVIYQAKEKLTNEIDLIIDIEPETGDIVAEIVKDLKESPFSEMQKNILEDNFAEHKKVSEKGLQIGKGYFVYIIRPIQDIEGITTYLVLLRSSPISDETIGSFQTLINLTLLSFNKLNQKQMKGEIEELEKSLEKVRVENLEKGETIKHLEEKLNLKRTLVDNIERWRNYITRNKFKLLFDEMINYAKEHKLKELRDACEHLFGMWNDNEDNARNGFIDNSTRTQELNRIRQSSIDLLNSFFD